MKRFVKLICLVLAFIMVMAVPAGAQEITPYASNYFMSYNAYFDAITSTSFEVWFSVTALRQMEKLGVSYIDIERSSDGSNWRVVKTYNYSSYPEMMGYTTIVHGGHITYSDRESGYQYRVYLNLYAKEGSGSSGYGVYIYL